MNRVVWIVVAALTLLCFAGIAMAQPDPAQMVERQLTAMKDRLKLNADQEKKMKDILTDQMKQQMAMRQKYNIQQGERPSDDAMAAMKKLREDTSKKMAEVLTKDQMTEYEKMMEERRAKGGGGFGGGRKKQQ